MVDPDRPCAGDPDVATSVALGLADGRERAELLAHLQVCPSCRAQTDEAARTVDRLLLAAPVEEPPPGFDGAVVGEWRRRPRRAWRRLAAAAAVVALLAAGGVAGWLLRTPPGPAPVASTAMVAPDGRTVGEVWARDGEPTWLVVSVPGWSPSAGYGATGEGYAVVVSLSNGQSIRLDAADLAGGSHTWGTGLGARGGSIVAVSVVDGAGGIVCSGRFA